MSSEIDIDVIRWLKLMESRLRSLERVELPVAGSGGFAPSDAQYLTLATSTGLSNERVFTPVAPIVGTDGGAGAAYSLSVTGSALTRVNDTNVTLTLGGTPATSLLATVSLTLGWTGLLAVARGGTGIGSYSIGDLLYATGATTLAQLAIGASGRVLSSNGTAPLWSTLASLGIISGSGVANEVAFFDGTNTIASSPRITRSASGNLLSVTSGAAADVPLTLVGHASISDDIFRIVTSALTKRLYVRSDFSLVHSINLSATNLVGALFNEASTLTSGTINGVQLALSLNPASSTGSHIAIGGSFSVTSNAVGGVNFTGAASRLSGGQFVSTHNGAGNWLAQHAGYFALNKGASSGTTTNAYGLYYIPTLSGGTITNHYGLYLENVVGATLSYAVYTNSGIVRLGDTVQLANSTAPGSSPVDLSQLYSADRWGTAGAAWPHARTEPGTVIALIGETAANVINTTNYNLTVPATGTVALGTGVADEVAFFSNTNTIASSPRITRSASGNLLVATSGAASDVPITAKGHASQSGNLIQGVDASDNVIVTFGPTGVQNLYGTGGAAAITRFAGAATYSLVRVDGALGAESAVLSGEQIGAFAARSWISGTFPSYSTQGVASFAFIATENHGPGAYGTYFRIVTTPTGTASATVGFIVSANGNLGIGILTEAGASATRTLYIQSGTAPTGNLTDASQFYNADRWGTAGDGWPHFRSEAGTVRALIGEVSADVIGTTSYSLTVPATGTAALRSDKLSAFAATTSAELAGVISDETGSGALVFGTLPTIASPTISGTSKQVPASGDGAVLRLVHRKTGIADATATEVFKIETTNETGSNDGGVYTCVVEAVVSHSGVPTAGNLAAKRYRGSFTRAVIGSGAAGVTTAVEDTFTGASAASTPATRDINTIVMTTAESSEYDLRVSFNIDLTGSSVTTAEITILVTVVYGGFLTPPVITGL